MTNHLIDYFKNYLAEDIGDGDHSTLSSIPKQNIDNARLLIKQEGVIAGLDVIFQLFKYVEPDCKINFLKKDGDWVLKGETAFTITASTHTLLSTERLALNILQRMSGIATETKSYVDLIKDLPSKILDTRKTTPGFRFFEKEAVRIGGGINHRMGLYDMIMLKDNHIDFAGGLENAIDKANEYIHLHNKDLKIEVETRNLYDVERVIKHGKVHRIMLDNFTPQLTREAIMLINNYYETESSGGITKDNIREYAITGVDYISIGALTHQVKSLDMSLKAVI